MMLSGVTFERICERIAFENLGPHMKHVLRTFIGRCMSCAMSIDNDMEAMELTVDQLLAAGCWLVACWLRAEG